MCKRETQSSEDIQSFGWTPLEDLSGDCNGHWALGRLSKTHRFLKTSKDLAVQFGQAQGIDLALLLARNSSCKAGSMGCAIADQSGMIIAGGSLPFLTLLTLNTSTSAMQAM